ncbi:histidinol-phosphate transaminase [Chlorobium phaeobacteroides]|jgi:histidinol-phosphate aminotransferase|uniref:Histidinol-phosphate aminotransferase n=1 Tax=Chlorobium phaeobacteroides (strain DSM 266 / SMG 266 / 2430) TaxID=290317 RepID=HIS8_CHLPD|nr:histidinol-phosphate transaminase [Chlorobium phaeobacteroides]A1BGB4.1 RecName: Full=Histidinol-phosphate aminotransferase; AltName: Full=Imidazole acetol-phosphate transaminase [Chlorobium phaeobacteroides DSM 266]ABL65441.1 histidinol phosphate aminotransferase apoenzyme [Chlorobium phaeobacteroides DSM 266]MBV5326195.1 histidinol-phosphate transaminase [Chlorobium sp.]
MKRDIQELLNPALRDLKAYNVEGGQQAGIKLNQNESPFDLPLWLKEEVLEAFEKEPWNRYPDILPFRGMRSYASFVGVPADAVMMSNGSNEMLYTIFLACLGPGKKILIPEPSFSLYEKIARLLHTEVVFVPMLPGLAFDADAIIRKAGEERVDFIVLSTPNNPTGMSLASEEVCRIAEAADALVLVDEAYIEFSRQKSVVAEIARLKNLIVLRTMSKALALAGMRIGFAIADPALMAEIAKPKIPFASSRLSEITLQRVLANYYLVTDAVSYILHERERLSTELKGIGGVELYESDTNFIIIRVRHAHELFCELSRRDILVRDVSGYPLMENCLRFNIGLRDENDALLQQLRLLCDEPV